MSLEFASPVVLPGLAIAEGATTPNPGTTHSLVFSTTTGTIMRWTGTAWTAIAATGGSGSKISELTELAVTGLGAGDVYVVLDTSDTTMAASGTNKKVRVPVRTARTTADYNNNTVTPSNISGLSFDLESGRAYHFKFAGKWQTAATTTGIGFQLTGPAVTHVMWRIAVQQAASGTDSYYNASANALATNLVNASAVAINTDYYFEVEGIILPSAAGTLQLRGRSEVASSNILISNGAIGILTDCG